MIGSEAYAAAVASTIARLAAIQSAPRPAPVAITPDASKVAHHCRECELSWRGSAPCWSCGAEGVQHADLTTNERSLWAFSNASHGNFSEGEQCADS